MAFPSASIPKHHAPLCACCWPEVGQRWHATPSRRCCLHDLSIQLHHMVLEHTAWKVKNGTKMLGILSTIFKNAQRLCSTNGTRIARYISQIGNKITSKLPGDGTPEGPRNIPSDVGCVLGPNWAAKTSEHFSKRFQKLPIVFPTMFRTMKHAILPTQIPPLSKETC